MKCSVEGCIVVPNPDSQLCVIHAHRIDRGQSLKTPQPADSAFTQQEGGEHYKNLPIQPARYCHANRLGKLESDVIYYVTRWREKNGIPDLRKARHTLDLLIEMEEQNAG